MTKNERAKAHIAAFRRWQAERDATRRQRLSLNPDEPRDDRQADQQPVIDSRPLAEQLGLRIRVDCDQHDAYDQFVDAVQEVLTALPELDRNLLAVRWRDMRPTVTLADQLDRGQRSCHDPHSGDFRFCWTDMANLPPDLLRAALAHEFAHAITAIRESRSSEDTAMRLAASWGHPPFPR